MSQTKVKVPELSPSEYDVLIDALKYYLEAQKGLAVSRDTTVVTYKEKQDARALATLSQDLLEKIG